jgi:hypothetical protein
MCWNQTLAVKGCRASQLERASQEYLAIERAISGRAGCDAVLVSVESLGRHRTPHPPFRPARSAFDRPGEQRFRRAG